MPSDPTVERSTLSMVPPPHQLARTRLSRPSYVKSVSGWLLLAASLCASLSCNAGRQGRPRAIDLASQDFDNVVRPQDDFYRYVNGRWIAAAVIPTGRSGVGAESQLQDAVEAEVQTAVEAASLTTGALGTPEQVVGDYYLTLLDSTSIQSQGATPLLPYLREIDAVGSLADLASLFGRMMSAIQVPLLIQVKPDPKQSDRNVVTIRQWGLGLPARDLYLLSDSTSVHIRARYQHHVEAMLQLANLPSPAEDARRVLALETKLATAWWDGIRNQNPNLSHTKVSFDSLQRLTPHIEWSALLSAAGLPHVDEVNLRQASYVFAVDTLLSQMPLEDWRSYLRFALVSAAVPALGKEFGQESRAFRRGVLAGATGIEPWWTRARAIAETNENLFDATAQVYAKRYVRPDTKARVLVLVNQLVAAFHGAIDYVEWMTPATKRQAHEKLDRISFNVAYPDNWQDYRRLVIRRGDAVGNQFRAWRFFFEEDYAQLGKPTGRGGSFQALLVNAFYNAQRNEIDLPAAILRSPFFEADGDMASNFGALGTLVGHEISHAFDTEGRQFDGAGNLRDWWTTADADSFNVRVDQLVTQYDAYVPIPGVHLNGRRTVGENMSDLGGLAVAYRAYRSSRTGDSVIGGLSGDQRFFVAYARRQRAVGRDEDLRTGLLSSSHSPYMYRVNGTLTNFSPFYDAWSVRAGDRMYRPINQRVRIW